MTHPTGGLVAVHAHPDDESLATGALLATWAAAGLPVAVVTATRGERGEVIGERWAHLEGDGPALAAHRVEELRAALAALGVRDHVFLDEVAGTDRRYEDSGMAWVAGARAGAAEDVPRVRSCASRWATRRRRWPACCAAVAPTWSRRTSPAAATGTRTTCACTR
ncbi:PIG-L family deacetylase [Cellulomonas sp. JZ18]|uniref:PIG-L family deacetylase n=1 Tax=Cellulomonas sp. JZ18 TaxID=2654191 RepID=UPI002108196E|nr:PIG-L family deacetylase [Cellulomonas sp. JZ18]